MRFHLAAHDHRVIGLEVRQEPQWKMPASQWLCSPVQGRLAALAS
jgi:hypothetical protein